MTNHSNEDISALTVEMIEKAIKDIEESVGKPFGQNDYNVPISIRARIDYSDWRGLYGKITPKEG
jgi:hypothetical protein